MEIDTAPPRRQMQLAVAWGDARRVRALLDVDPALLDAPLGDDFDVTPLMWACRHRRESVVDELIGRGADVARVNRVTPDGDGGNAALWFVAQGEPEGTTAIARRLIDAGADVDRRGEHGRTALFIAAAWVHLDLVQCLVEHGADRALADAAGVTPLAHVRDMLAWCGRQSSLDAPQQKFATRAPNVIAYLESAVGG